MTHAGNLYSNPAHLPLADVLPALILRYVAKFGKRPAAVIVHADQDPGTAEVCGLEVDTTDAMQRWHIWLVEEE